VFGSGLNFSRRFALISRTWWRAETTMTDLSVPILALIVEDDEEQREIVAEILREQDMDVIECESAEAAELVVAKCGAELKLLVADVRLAGHGTGIELAQFAQERFPHLNIVIVSGLEGLSLPPNVRFLKKPYRQHDLLRACIGHSRPAALR
jgi:DNA-binding NtrC family response regulator